MKKNEYQNLINKRKTCILCKANHFKNQSETDYDFDEIGNWTTWSNNLDADIMIVGQDYSDTFTFERDKGVIEVKELNDSSLANEYTTVTNYYLRELTKLIGYDIGIPTKKSNAKVFLTNSVLCLKHGELDEKARVMSKSIPTSVYKKCGTEFLKPTIEIVQPRVIVTLGATATKAVINAYSDDIDNSKKLLASSFSTIFKDGKIIIKNTNSIIFPVYHTGMLGQNNRKKNDESEKSGFELMKEDWLKIKKLVMT